MGKSAVGLDIVDGGSIAVVTLNRPDALNALNPQEAEDLKNLMDAALETAKTLTRLPPMVLAMEKKMLDASYCESLDQHLDRELAYVGDSGGSVDFREGCEAFFEKRPPVFKGK